MSAFKAESLGPYFIYVAIKIYSQKQKRKSGASAHEIMLSKNIRTQTISDQARPADYLAPSLKLIQANALWQ